MTDQALEETNPATTDASHKIFEHSNGHAALYVDGSLAFVASNATDIFRQALELHGVSIENSNDFLRGADAPAGLDPNTLADLAAPDLAAVLAWSTVKDQVAALRAQADELVAQADALEHALFRDGPSDDESSGREAGTPTHQSEETSDWPAT